MKRKLFGILSLSALAATAISLSSCSLSDEEIFDLNYRRVFIENNLSTDGGQNGVVSGEIRVFTAFTPDFEKKNGRVTWKSYLEGANGNYDTTTNIEAEKYIPISKVNTEMASSIEVKSPSAGLDDVTVYVVATVEMGEYSKDVVWKLTLEALKVKNSALQTILNKMFARIGDGTDNNFKGNKEDANGELVRGFGFNNINKSGVLDSVVGGIITSSMDEYVNSYTNGRLFNILADTNENIFSSISDTNVANALATTMTDVNNLGSSTGTKTLAQAIIEALTTGKINNEELDDSDKGALSNSGVKAVFDKIAKVIKNINVSSTYEGNDTYNAIIAYANTL